MGKNFQSVGKKELTILSQRLPFCIVAASPLCSKVGFARKRGHSQQPFLELELVDDLFI